MWKERHKVTGGSIVALSSTNFGTDGVAYRYLFPSPRDTSDGSHLSGGNVNMFIGIQLEFGRRPGQGDDPWQSSILDSELSEILVFAFFHYFPSSTKPLTPTLSPQVRGEGDEATTPS
jgi:hypothetical protein